MSGIFRVTWVSSMVFCQLWILTLVFGDLLNRRLAEGVGYQGPYVIGIGHRPWIGSRYRNVAAVDGIGELDIILELDDDEVIASSARQHIRV